MAETTIQWTSGPNGEQGYTLNPWLGCSKVPGHKSCAHCYAEKAQPVVMRKGGGVQWGPVWQGGQRVVVSESTWRKPLQWARDAARAGQRRRVFCASLSDVLEVPNDAPDSLHDGGAAALRVAEVRDALAAARERLWNVIRDTVVMGGDRLHPCRPSPGEPGLDWLLLSKRPENWRLVPDDVRPLVWLGTSIADQKTADEWVPRLLAADGFRLRFLSLEPMVAPVDLTPWLDGLCVGHCRSGQRPDWLLVGGESGPNARECRVEWILDVVRQCQEAGVPVYVKQLGSVWAKANDARWPDGSRDTHGANTALWPEALRVHQHPVEVFQ